MTQVKGAGTHATRPRHTDVFVWASLVALSAYGGAVGLVAGVLDLGPVINQRLPLHSPVLAALALTMAVAIPSTVVAVLAWRGDVRTATALTAAGWALIGWIVVEIAFIRELAFLQVFYACVGIAFVVAGRRLTR